MSGPGGEGTSMAGLLLGGRTPGDGYCRARAAMAVPLTARSVDTLRARDAAVFHRDADPARPAAGGGVGTRRGPRLR